MSQRKTRQAVALADYRENRSPSARWFNEHKTRCQECGKGNDCQLVIVARYRGMLKGA